MPNLIQLACHTTEPDLRHPHRFQLEAPLSFCVNMMKLMNKVSRKGYRAIEVPIEGAVWFRLDTSDKPSVCIEDEDNHCQMGQTWMSVQCNSVLFLGAKEVMDVVPTCYTRSLSRDAIEDQIRYITECDYYYESILNKFIEANSPDSDDYLCFLYRGFSNSSQDVEGIQIFVDIGDLFAYESVDDFLLERVGLSDAQLDFLNKFGDVVISESRGCSVMDYFIENDQLVDFDDAKKAYHLALKLGENVVCAGFDLDVHLDSMEDHYVGHFVNDLEFVKHVACRLGYQEATPELVWKALDWDAFIAAVVWDEDAVSCNGHYFSPNASELRDE